MIKIFSSSIYMYIKYMGMCVLYICVCIIIIILNEHKIAKNDNGES